MCELAGMARLLRGTDLRYTLTRLLQVLGPLTVTELCAELDKWGFAVEGRPTKVVSDALRWEMRRDRVRRRGHGLYGAGCAPGGTAYRIIDRVSSLREEAEALRAQVGTPSSDAESLSRHADSLADEAESLTLEADSLAHEAESLTLEAESLSHEAQSLNREAESLIRGAKSLGGGNTHPPDPAAELAAELLDQDRESLDQDRESLDQGRESLDPETESLEPDPEPLDPDAESLRGGNIVTRTFESVSDNPFKPQLWQPVPGFADLTDITYHRHVLDGVAQPTVRVAFNRPEVRNAFRPHTVDELYQALDHARMSADVGVVLLTGNGPSPKDGGWAFCSGGDQRIRGRTGYQYAAGETADSVDAARAGRLHILEVQRLIRFMPKPVICLVNGWAAGGGHSLHVVCDLTLASREHARFKQTDADVGSFDGGYGSAYLARQVGQKFAREIFFLGRTYTAEQMHQMGAVNEVVDHAELEAVALHWAAEINAKSPQAQRMLKFAFNLLDDGLVGQQLFAGEATRLAYMTDEAVEGRDAFLEKREPDWSPFPRYF